jgi:hypothetical protein
MSDRKTVLLLCGLLLLIALVIVVPATLAVRHAKAKVEAHIGRSVAFRDVVFTTGNSIAVRFSETNPLIPHQLLWAYDWGNGRVYMGTQGGTLVLSNDEGE